MERLFPMLHLSPAATASFAAVPDDGWRPPDTMGAVGPSHLMVTLNGTVAIQTKTGDVLASFTLDSFWSGLSPLGTFDPASFYDPYAGRWVVVSAADDNSATSSVLVGASMTGDPTGTWNKVKYPADPSHLTWADHPHVGFNKDWIVVQANMFPVAGSTGGGTKIYVIPKAQLYAGLAPVATIFSSSTLGPSPAPALTYDDTVGALYLLQVWAPSAGMLRLYSITGPIGSETLSTVAWPTSTTNSDSAPPILNFLPQLGSAQKISAGWSEIGDVVYRNGSIWGLHTVFLPFGGSPTRSSIMWWEITASGAVHQNGLIDDPTGEIFYAYPGLAVNKNNDVLIGYSRFSGSTYASAAYSFRKGSDPLNALQSDTLLKAGEGTYSKPDPDGENRWGDYSRCAVDPANDIDLWTIQEYAMAPADKWGTWWGRVGPPTPGGLAVTPAADMSASGIENGPFTPSSWTCTLTNTGGTSIDWTAGAAQPWITLSPTGGTLAPSTSAVVTVWINAGANALAPGSYSDSVTFTNTTNGTGNAERRVTLDVGLSQTQGSGGGGQGGGGGCGSVGLDLLLPVALLWLRRRFGPLLGASRRRASSPSRLDREAGQ